MTFRGSSGSMDSGISSACQAPGPSGGGQIEVEERAVVWRDLGEEASLAKCPLCRALLAPDRDRHFSQHPQELFASGLHDNSRFISVQLALFDLMKRAGLVVENLKKKVLEKGLLKYPDESKRLGYRCQTCLNSFYRTTNLKFHKRKCQVFGVDFFCRFCDCIFENSDELAYHFETYSARNRCFPYDSLLKSFDPHSASNEKATSDLIIQQNPANQAWQSHSPDNPNSHVQHSSPNPNPASQEPPKELSSANSDPNESSQPFNSSTESIIIEAEIPAGTPGNHTMIGRSDPIPIPSEFRTRFVSRPTAGVEAYFSTELSDPRRNGDYNPGARRTGPPPRKNVVIWNRDRVTETCFVPDSAPERLFFISYDYMPQYRFMGDVNQR